MQGHGLGLAQFGEWVAMVALECEWFRRRDSDPAVRVERFIQVNILT
jgi:hypothetical protein